MDPGGRKGGTARHSPRAAQAPYLEYHPSLKELRVWQKGDNGYWRPWLRGSMPEIGAGGHLLPQRVGQELRRREKRHPLPWTPSGMSSVSGWLGKLKLVKPPGWWRELLVVPEVQDCKELAWMVCRPRFILPKGQVSLIRWRITIRPLLHHCVSSEWISCHLPILSSPAGIFDRCKERRWWQMLKCFSIGWRRLICTYWR